MLLITTVPGNYCRDQADYKSENYMPTTSSEAVFHPLTFGGALLICSIVIVLMLQKLPWAMTYLLFHVSVKVAGHSLGQHCSHQFVSLLSLHLQLLCPLSNQILQVGWVLLQHPQHWVNNVCLLSLSDVLELSAYKRGNTNVISSLPP